ncbi:sulfite exporter TauE/SafE family protein [Microvirga makkahensis]|uniref:Probable membrane transporter protein n=1 Tax=Microvirga makkahensis TaxID=1128670 RepID=A0A7X3SPA4_9HYPH|nr:sulfite exporter TauE/SafE family protein [Microvirga makkahensis]MXQ12261.1 TSUP family transporter [Microvirga makkahensis]
MDATTPLVLAVFLLAGVTKGVIGMGLPTIAMGLLVLVMPPVEAAAILLVPSLVTNVWQLLAGPDVRSLLRRLWSMMAAVTVGTFVGIRLLVADDSGVANMALGVALAAYGILGLLGRTFQVKERHEAWASPLVGFATGITTGATGVFVIPAVPYLQSLGLAKNHLIQALGLSFTVSTLALGAALYGHGEVRLTFATPAILALLASLVGMHVGRFVRDRLEPDTFRKVFFACLLLLGLYSAFAALA